MISPSKEQFDTAFDRITTYPFAQEHDIAIPETFFPHTSDDINTISQTITFPCIVKQPDGTGGNGNTYVSDKEELISLFEQLAPQDWPVVQKVIPGTVIGIAAVCADGQIRDFFSYAIIRQYPDSGGPTTLARSLKKNDILLFQLRVL